LLGALLAVLALACRGAPHAAGAAASVSASGSARIEPVPERLAAVASADELALRGARVGGAEGTRALFAAAELRERLFRLEHRRGDALEALEIYGHIARSDAPSRCEAELRQARLQAELEAEPALLRSRAEAWAEPSARADRACAEEARRVLKLLAAYRRSADPMPARGGESAPSAIGSGPSHDGAALPPPLATGPVRLLGIERFPGEDAARVVVTLSGPAEYSVQMLPAEAARGPRLVVDVLRATPSGPNEVAVGGLVERVRLGRQPNGTRVVLDLKAAVRHRVFYLLEPFRVVLDVAQGEPRDPGGVAAPKPSNSEARVPAGDPASKSASSRRLVRRVVLDPGHGGHDPGATGPGGLREKDVTLDIAHRAAPLLARELGISTLLTRDSDAYVSLPERTARANAFQADLFVSIHCNASEDGAGRGVMTFVLDESQDALASRIAATENAASAAAGSELARALSHSVDARSRAASAHFAGLLQRAALASLAPHYPGIPDRGVRRAGFFVLAGAEMPSVLFEASFISDPSGEIYLNTGDYRQKLADAIVNAVRAYRDGL
jgi:N-acetylmuramoyl-L-alanine amidase